MVLLAFLILCEHLQLLVKEEATLYLRYISLFVSIDSLISFHDRFACSFRILNMLRVLCLMCVILGA